MTKYPMLLKQINDPPKKLYIAGNEALLTDPDTKFLCVVGSRRYTDYGKALCTSLIESLRGLPVVIVSGLSLGIDTIAHRTAIDNNLKTIAVPGSGLNPYILYPRSNLSLAEEIISQDGLLLSEYEPTTCASPWSFPVRNRIMAGLSHAVLIIEAEEDSGTLITARLALDYNRDVLAVPGSIFSSSSHGPNWLLKKGAIPITRPQDLIEYLGYSIKHPSDEEVKKLLLACSEEERSLLLLLTYPLTREELFKKLDLPIGQIQIMLSMLEIRKLIKEEAGKVISLYPNSTI